jgi:hypothetical protein
MATSESRSPFRLPWSSDRSHEEPDRFTPVATADEAAVDEANPAVSSWSDPDSAAEPRFPSADSQPPDPVATADDGAAGGPAMTGRAATPAHVAPRKPTKLMVDLATAIRATTEAARDQALAAVEVEATDVTGAIRAASTEGAEALRRRSDEDLTGIKEWSKTEIARIRDETEARIGTRKATLATELAAYASAVEHRIGEVDGAVARYRADMDAYFESLAREEDPSRLATMAEAMPEPLALDAWKDISDLDLTAFVPVPVAAPEPEAAVGAVVEAEAVVETEAVAEAIEPEAVAATIEPEAVAEAIEPEAVEAEAQAVAETIEPEAEATEAVDVEIDAAPNATGSAAAERPNPWGVPDDAWTTGATARSAHANQDGSTVSAEGGDPVDRAAIMAALEAAAEAVVAAESAAESADQAEAAADAAAATAGMMVGRATEAGRATQEESADADAVMNARVDAGGFDSQSFADRLASLLPSHGDGAADGEPRTTQVVVTGLVSVASIASFKRHLGRLAGVQAVGVASGPGGEFVFHVTHRPDVSFRDVIPSMPGFGARVTATGDGIVSVTARDPEAEA